MSLQEVMQEIRQLKARVLELERENKGPSLEEAGKALSDSLRPVRNIQAVGIGAEELVVYLIEPQPAPKYPNGYRGFPVRTVVSGRMIIGNPE